MDGGRRRQITLALFGVYSGVMLLILFGLRLGQQTEMRWNLHLFDTLKRYLWVLRNSTDVRQRFFASVNLSGNVLLFVPLGIFLPMLFSPFRVWWKALLGTLAILLLIEVLQLLSRLGSCDVDDLLLNAVGAFLGWLLWSRKKNENKRTYHTSRT